MKPLADVVGGRRHVDVVLSTGEVVTSKEKSPVKVQFDGKGV